MTPTQLQEKYRLECAVYADRAHLVRWLKVVPQKQECFVGICIICPSSCLLAGGILFIYFHRMFRVSFLVAGICYRW